jgi:uncharacterized membrane protein YedE/YeeE
MLELNLQQVGMAIAGGVLIGLASSLLILFNGRIAGISGILGGLLYPGTNDVAWRFTFLAGLVVSPLVYGLLATLPVVEVEAEPWLLILAGLLVGFGTRLGSGCTSGHGVCGIARVSRRSIAATLVFIVSGMLTVYVMRHLL